MSQHPSLKVDSVGVKHRNVLKKYERIKKMEADGKWSGEASVYGLPKYKSIKIKVKKSAGGPKEAAAGEKGAAPAAGAPAEKAKAAAPAEKAKK
ncbi:MAG TPA: small basic protein [Verrucomicrobiae bacterium]|nr:small basic protein [Verrucomicrobiae bacterium]